MSLTFGFYDSLNGDRKHTAKTMSQIFDGIINDGVFMSVGDKLMVTANSGLKVNVGVGRAWFNSSWTYLDSVLNLTLDVSDLVLNRIDAIVLETNSNDAVRANTIKIVKGAPATNPVNPTMVKSEKVNQYPLAYIYVGKNVTEITNANITNKVGTVDTPFVTGILETMDIDALILQWGTEWNEWTDQQTTDFTTWMVNQVNDYESWSIEQRNIFEAWFQYNRNTIGEDTAGQLLTLMGDVSHLLTNEKSNLVGAINELFLNVSDAKELISAELTDQKIHASGDDTFEKLSLDIRQVRSVGSTKKYSTYELMMRFGFDPVRALF